ncbi:glycosyltransferase family 2 protein [Paraburkholderia sp. GAS42]|uniref:glycosyltransferase family 2 protein n=1 Tax=Paraburkholderia sp. GAS42 TaxID=3035135 RepID=UPI003D1AEE59
MASNSVPHVTNPVLSIVVLCYNQEDYIGACLQSVLTQKVDVPFEVVIGDDGSKDGSVEVIESFRARYPGIIKLVRHESNVGYSRNFADVIAETSGEYIACIDGDDMMLPGKLARQLDFLETQRDFGMVVHKMRTINSKTEEPVDFPLPRAKPAVFDAEYLIERGPFFFTSSAMFRGELRRRYPVNLDLKAVADVANLMQSFYGTRARYLDEEMGLYRVNPQGFTSTVIKNPARHETNISDMMKTYRMAEDLGMDKGVVDRGRARLYLGSAIMYLETGHYPEFERCIATSMRFGRISSKQAGLHAMRHWPRTLRRSYTFAKQMFGRTPTVRV